MSAHHHVIAVQDWGGSQEYFRGEPDPLTREQAEQLVTDMADADRLTRELDRWDEAERKYGDRLDDLVSSNVCPGWDAMWITTCGMRCAFDDIWGRREKLGDPVWPRDEQPADANVISIRDWNADAITRQGGPVEPERPYTAPDPWDPNADPATRQRLLEVLGE